MGFRSERAAAGLGPSGSKWTWFCTAGNTDPNVSQILIHHHCWSQNYDSHDGLVVSHLDLSRHFCTGLPQATVPFFFPAALTNSYPSRLPTRPGPAYCEIMDLVIICVCACISSSDHAILHHRSTGEKHRPLKRKQSFWVVPGRKGL